MASHPPSRQGAETPGSDGDVFVISFPKCGRTWLRVLMAKAISASRGIPMDACQDLDLTGFSDVDPTVPRIVFGHDDGAPRKKPHELSADKSFYHDRKVVLLVRDIRDVTVSRYFQRTRRKVVNPYEGELAAFLSEEEGGVLTCLTFWDIWHSRQHVPASFLLTSYERLTTDTAGELARVLDFCGLPSVGEEALREAVSFGDFSHMHAMELTDALKTDRLRTGTPDDPESFKTRRGLVGGFRDYLTEEQISRLTAQVREHLATPWQEAALAAEPPVPHP